MNKFRILLQWVGRITSLSVVVLILSACADDGAPGPQGASGTLLPVERASSATSLGITINGVTIASAPVVTFTVTNQDGDRARGLSTSDLRFTIAKLMPGSNGDPSAWQNYILTNQLGDVAGSPGEGNTAVQATRENNGTLVDNNDGTYSYTFATDIASVSCPAPCTDAEGNALDVSYQPTLTHRLGIQTRGSLPAVNAVYTFRPSDGATSGLFTRDIVKTDSCNECHNELEAHDARIDTAYCVTCHNPGSTDPDSGHTVDFKVMVHKIHRGEDLPSGSEYAIWGYGDNKHDYSTVVFPQDIRNCTKCHDGADSGTPDGDNWKTQISMAACGSCHDDKDFSKDGTPLGANDPAGHSGGIISGNSYCATCHGVGTTWSVEESHAIPVNVAATRFQYNILTICGTAVSTNPADPKPDCAGAAPTVTFSVSDPTGATTHGYGNLYDIADVATGPAPGQDPEYSTAGAGLNILTGWGDALAPMLDYNNDAGAGSRPARANSTSAIANATDNGDGTFTITLPALPIASGSAAVAMEGHPRGESVVGSGTYNLNVPVRGAVAYFTVNGGTLAERRVAVDIISKCDNCHNNLSLHGANRADNAQLCVMCHNPRNTDIGRRDNFLADGVTAGSDGIPEVGLDGKMEETIDMKVLIHGIHAGDQAEHGIRENGIVIYGYGGRAHDYSHVRFPGILSDCTTCHNTGTYELDGDWAAPLQNGIQATTMKSAPTAVTAGDFTAQKDDQSDDLMTTPTAAVCTACHDSDLSKAHMTTLGGAVFEGNSTAIGNSYETCSVCHGPGAIADVKVVHGVE